MEPIHDDPNRIPVANRTAAVFSLNNPLKSLCLMFNTNPTKEEYDSRTPQNEIHFVEESGRELNHEFSVVSDLGLPRESGASVFSSEPNCSAIRF